MRVLLVTASKHGSTRHIGYQVADELRGAGHEVACRDVADELDLDADAAVVGSAVYGARVMSDGRACAERLTRELRGPVWTFAVGLKGITIDPLRSAVTAPTQDGYRGGRYPIFGGVVDSAGLSLAESALIGALGANDRDRRDPDAVAAWAQVVARQLSELDQGIRSTLPVV